MNHDTAYQCGDGGVGIAKETLLTTGGGTSREVDERVCTAGSGSGAVRAWNRTGLGMGMAIWRGAETDWRDGIILAVDFIGRRLVESARDMDGVADVTDGDDRVAVR